MSRLNNKLGRGIYLFSIVAIPLTLFGCGGEGNEGSTGSSSSNTQSATLSAQNATYSTGYAESFEVDLSSKVFSSAGGGFVLSEVEVLSNDDSCQLESMTETGFIIQASDTKVCDYRYHVTPKTLSPMSANSSLEGSSSAVTRIAVSSYPSSTELVPISATTLVNEGVSVSLKTELNKVGFTLGNEFVLTGLTLPYGRASAAKINDTDDQVIDYAPPQGFTGIDRVLYTLEDSVNGLVLMGVLDVAVGYEANQGFTIDDNIVYPDVVNVLTDEEIDISGFVSSDDSDDYQLVYIESFNAKAVPKDPLDTQNKTIVFQASQPGYHYISFAVSDHNGTYDMGLIRVEVTDPNQSSKWGDIYHLSDLYTGPPTALEAVAEGLPYDMKLSDVNYSPAIDMAGFRYPSAVAYCDTIGASLPTVEQVTQMTSDTDVQLLHNWPVQANYLAYDDVVEQPMWVDLTDGSTRTGNVDPTSAYYVTCVQQALIDVLPISSTQVVANGVDVGSVFVKLIIGQEANPDTLVTASVSSPNVTLDSDAVTTDSNGIAQFRLTSLKAETVTLTFDVNGITQDYEVKFIGDEKTAGVMSEATIDTALYTSAEGGEVTATLTDQNGNPVEGYSVTSEVSSGTHPDTAEVVTPILEAETTQTDKSGEQKVRVKWDTNYQIPTTTSMTFDVTSSYTTTTSIQTDAISKVTFIGYVCGGQIGDDDKQNAGGSCIKITKSGGVLYTGSPSLNFLSELGYYRYDADATLFEYNINSEFAQFNYSSAIALCNYYNKINLNGKNDWRLATLPDYDRLFADLGNMYDAKGWPIGNTYWSSTGDQNAHDAVSLRSGSEHGATSEWPHLVSCVSRY